MPLTCSAKNVEDSHMLDVKVNAPELQGGRGWLNTDQPIKLSDLRGKIVLLDFWTFCCINCMHIIPDLKNLEHKYANELVVIGVHSAKFENEKNNDNIREAILRCDIEHPVVNDADFKIWQSYAVNAWPTLVLIDPAGKIVATTSGEGHFDVLDQKIHDLITEFAKQGKLDRRPRHFVLEKSKLAKSPLSFPGKITADESTKRLFISDSGHNRIVIVDSTNGKVLNVIGDGNVGKRDGSFVTANFHHPQGLAYADGKLYIADTENHLIRVADLSAKTVRTVAGTGVQAAFRSQGGKTSEAALNSPWDLVLIGHKLYIAMSGAHQIWCLDLSRETVVPYAGNGRENIADGTLDDASLAQPSGLTTDGHNLYFADSEVSAVRSADLSPEGKVKTLIGQGLFDFGDIDGTRAQARLQHPLGVLWHDGKLYVADSYNHKIKIIDPNSHTVSTFLGNGKPGFTDGQTAQFSEPAGLTVIGNTLYIADTNNNKIRSADLTSKKVETLNIQNLLPPKEQPASKTCTQTADTDSDVGPNVQHISMPAHKLKPGVDGKLTINIALPKGYHLNTEAPCTYKIKQQGDALQIPVDALQATLKHPSLSYTVPFKTGITNKASTVTITIPVYVCDDGPQAICALKTLEIRILIQTSAAAPDSNLTLDCSVTAVKI